MKRDIKKWPTILPPNCKLIIFFCYVTLTSQKWMTGPQTWTAILAVALHSLSVPSANYCTPQKPASTGPRVPGDEYDASVCDILGGKEKRSERLDTCSFARFWDQPRGKQPGLLILDGFNSLGNATDDRCFVNVKFMKRLYELMDGMKNLCLL